MLLTILAVEETAAAAPLAVQIIGALGGAAGILALAKTIVSPFAQKSEDQIRRIVRESFDESKEELKGLIKEVDQKMERGNEIDKCLLRHQITSTYYKYKENHCLPAHVKEDVCHLYEQYSALKGNSYVHKIYDEMMEWEEG